jgi:hypothetical protein
MNKVKTAEAFKRNLTWLEIAWDSLLVFLIVACTALNAWSVQRTFSLRQEDAERSDMVQKAREFELNSEARMISLQQQNLKLARELKELIERIKTK